MTQAGAEPMMKHDLDRARQLVKESGYDGRPVVVIHVTDVPFINAATIVTRQRLESIGFNVVLKTDGLVVAPRRARQQGAARQGRLEHHAHLVGGGDVFSPVVHFGVSGAGPGAWFGWPDVPPLEKLLTDWMRTTDQGRRKQLAEEIQKVALEEVTYVPWGEWFQPTAFRKEVQGILKFTAPVFWNVKIT